MKRQKSVLVHKHTGYGVGNGVGSSAGKGCRKRGLCSNFKLKRKMKCNDKKVFLWSHITSKPTISQAEIGALKK
jgi:hypothetical protein